MQTGWVCSNGNWYYFYGDGTMAHDTTIDGYYLNSAGAWTKSMPTTTSTSYTGGNSSFSASSYVGNSQGQTVYVSRQGIYHSSPHMHTE